MSELTIRLLQDPDELEMAVDLQRVYWGNDPGDLVTGHMLLSIVRNGGHVHAAFDGEKLVGMLLGFLGADIDPEVDDNAPARILVMSKRMVVLPEYRGQRIGERLKLAQREYARLHNIQLVTWTFDPLLSRNAYLNLHKLGGVGQKYVPNYFGSAADNPVLSADRLVVNWWVRKPLADPPERYDDAVAVNETITNDAGLLVPRATHLSDNPVQVLEIPMEIVPLENMDPALGQEWRTHVRDAMQALMAAGYLATDFVRSHQLGSPFAVRGDERDRVFYVFTPDDGSNTFH